MQNLKKQLLQLDGKSYKAYKDIQGKRYEGDGWLLHIDYVQGDPFASPSRIRLEMSQSKAGYKKEWIHPSSRQTAFEDFIAREAAEKINQLERKRKGTGKSGLIYIDKPGQEILPRTAVKAGDNTIQLRLSVGLPAAGRRILGKEAAKLLCEDIPLLFHQTMFEFNERQLINHLELTDQQMAVREYMKKHQYICFVANGSILPRMSGVSNRPLIDPDVVAFRSPPSLEIEIPIPHREPIKGMALRKGIHLIAGGGYHGKSTLLKAIERGIYHHIKGDGREFVLTEESALKIRAEDGRRVEKVNISPFISNLPFGRDTWQFSTEDASGSTSQAANIMEALEMGTKVLLVDEDTSATNFMIRDARMQALISKEKEPITPFVDKVRQLYEEHDVSTILVLGGSGDYFDAADTVTMMDEYHPIDVTTEAKQIAGKVKEKRAAEGGSSFGVFEPRTPLPSSFDARRGHKEKVDAKGLRTILYGTTEIDLSYVEQLVDVSQTRAIAEMLRYIDKNMLDGRTSLKETLDHLYELIENEGLEAISKYPGKHPGDLALPRKMEAAAAMNRMRTLHIKAAHNQKG
ncbi:MAG TPA: ABC-ATPase domain-containing protein [Bacillus sp. (in: firmicutes)]|nr:ABC-ATPase domain-containing protein [Bacillus sp. (in: firmicutes)]